MGSWMGPGKRNARPAKDNFRRIHRVQRVHLERGCCKLPSCRCRAPWLWLTFLGLFFIWTRSRKRGLGGWESPRARSCRAHGARGVESRQGLLPAPLCTVTSYVRPTHTRGQALVTCTTTAVCPHLLWSHGGQKCVVLRRRVGLSCGLFFCNRAALGSAWVAE